MQLEAPEALSLEVRTECDVPKLYFDVKKLLRSYQGMCSRGVGSLPSSPPLSRTSVMISTSCFPKLRLAEWPA